MRGHVLHVFERAAVLQKVRDAGRAKRMIADQRGNAGRSSVSVNVVAA
jgi:hypothetical protein